MVLALSWGCGDDASECMGDGCEESSGDAGSNGTGKNSSILGTGATSYTESSEASNGTVQTPEATGYTLETAAGIAIHGSFEASSPTDDVYRFNAGTLGTASQPGFPGVDVRLVIDGDRTERNVPLGLSLDTVVEKGYSALHGGNYFINAALIKGQDYVITVGGGSPGKSYVLELRGHTP
jgi:hypothetical protein